MNTVCSICARGGSKGVPNKNLRNLNGKPLIQHSIEQALESGLFSAVAVSSDSIEILETAFRFGATILVQRPPELATDHAAKLPVIQHCLLEIERQSGTVCNYLVDLDATSPLRSIEDIVAAYRLLVSSDAQNVITAMPSRRSPYFNLIELDHNGFAKLSKLLPKPIVRRQDAPQCFDMNASIYAWRRDALLNSSSIFLDRTRVYIMPEERSIDIDSELDFQFVDFLMRRREASHDMEQ